MILRDRGLDPAPIVKRTNENLAEYQRINSWFVWPEEDFPRTSTQKPRINLIQQTVQAELRTRGADHGITGPLRDLIASVTRHHGTELSSQINLETDLNLSSLDRVELLGALEDRYRIDLNETRFAAVNTVGDLDRILHGQTPPRARYHYPRWVQRWPVAWIRLFAHYLLLRPAIFLLGWPRIEGRGNLTGVPGPVLVICNHISDVDVGFVLTALPARLRHKLATATGGEALEALRTPPPSRNFLLKLWDRVTWLSGVSLLNLFPLPREAGFRESFAFAGELVDRGYSVLVFPEGRHTTDGEMRPFRSGIGLLANNLAIPIVPMRIHGLFELKQAGEKFARPYTVRVKIGAPVRFPQGSDPAWIAGELQKKLGDL
jgi:long-chain acyl-CoA synthetase